ncbi:MAG: hypothetical protein ACE149_14335 [Armatimonadota bacterium]
MSQERPDPRLLVGLLQRYFLCRTDIVAFLAPWGKPCPGEVGDGLEALLLAHVQGTSAPKAGLRYRNRRGQGAISGHFRLGAYAPAPDNTTKWLCLDFDGGEHADALPDPKATALQTWHRFREAGLPAYLERSGSGKGWHLWCFFDPPLRADTARTLARAFVPEEVTLAGGEAVRTNTGRGVEVFPKQAKVEKRGYGNLVWLPWWSEAKGEANQFHQVGESGELLPCAPADFETVDAARVEAVIAASLLPPEPLPESADRGEDPSWRDWRKKALAALPLESVYGEWLTGRKHSTGWLECRDPWSPSGDRDPSAGVSDGTGQGERGQFHSFISGRSLSVFDFLVARGLAADFAEARRQIATLSGTPPPTGRPPEPATQAASPRPSRPQIRVNNRQLRDVVADAWQSVHAANSPPTLFRRSDSLARLMHGDGEPHLLLADEPAIYGLLARAADWVRVSDDAVVSVHPVREVARDMLAYPDPSLGLLDGVVGAPVFDSAGHLISRPGYHAQARLWYHQDADLRLPEVPDRPSPAQVEAARLLLFEELLVDFPFVSEPDRTHAVAAMLLPFVRRMVGGCTPIHLIEAPAPGSGKNLLADVVAVVATGRACEPTTVTSDEDETRKKVTALLAKAQPVILLDNVRVGIESAQLASALTAEVWSDRLLGQSRMIDLPNHATWLVTANNPRLSLEIARRCIRIRMDPRTDRPWQRVGFRHSPLRDWVRQHRADLVAALLILVQAWLAAGRPAGGSTLGSFEGWANVMGGVLAHAGIPGFLGNAEELYEAADIEGNEWREFVAAWWQVHQDRWVSAKDLLELALDRELLGSVIGDKSLRSQQIRLGLALAAARDRQFSQWRLLTRHDTHSKRAAYRLAEVSRGDDPAGCCGMTRGMFETNIPRPICPEEQPRLLQDETAGCCGMSEQPYAHARTGAPAHTHVKGDRGHHPATSREGTGNAPGANLEAPGPRDDAGCAFSTSRETSREDPADAAIDLAHLPEEVEE